MRRDLSLSPRVEEKRELKVIELPVQFSLKEIKEHFEESLNEVKAQYPVADLLNENRSHASAKKQDITKEFVETYITNIELIVNAIYDIALDNDIIK